MSEKRVRTKGHYRIIVRDEKGRIVSAKKWSRKLRERKKEMDGYEDLMKRIEAERDVQCKWDDRVSGDDESRAITGEVLHMLADISRPENWGLYRTMGQNKESIIKMVTHQKISEIKREDNFRSFKEHKLEILYRILGDTWFYKCNVCDRTIEKIHERPCKKCGSSDVDMVM